MQKLGLAKNYLSYLKQIKNAIKSGKTNNDQNQTHLKHNQSKEKTNSQQSTNQKG
jgi:Sec-independent protein translocase protein TatA